MKIPQLKKKTELKSCHNTTWEDDYSWVHQSNILEVLKDSSKLDPEVRKYLEEENKFTDFHLKDTNECQKKLFGKKVGQDFYEGKITLPIILLFQKAGNLEKEKLRDIFSKEKRNGDNLNYTLSLIKKYKIIKDCYQKAQHYINLASNSLSIFSDSDQKRILENLTSFSLSRNF